MTTLREWLDTVDESNGDDRDQRLFSYGYMNGATDTVTMLAAKALGAGNMELALNLMESAGAMDADVAEYGNKEV